MEESEMNCKYLSRYSFGGTSWSVSSCRAKAMPYVPSMMELHNFCCGGKHVLCPFYQTGMKPTCVERPTLVLAEAR